MGSNVKYIDIPLGCTGCSACVSICKTNAITMQPYQKPFIDVSKCINCGGCRRVCPIINDIKAVPVVSGYCGWNKDSNVIKESTSGGAFTAIADAWCSDSEGLVYATVFNQSEKKAEYKELRCEDLFRARKSKYVESDIGDVFLKIKESLASGQKCLFCGTPCHVAGLRSFLGKSYDNLITVDFICHGVPTQIFFSKYIGELEKQHGKLKNIYFREAVGGWTDETITYEFASGKKTIKYAEEDYYLYNFLHDSCLRESCYNCRFRKFHVSDIIIADFWGIFNAPSLLNKYHKHTRNGISLVLFNSKKGQELYPVLCNYMFLQDLSPEQWKYAFDCSNSHPNNQKLTIKKLSTVRFIILKCKHFLTFVRRIRFNKD